MLKENNSSYSLIKKDMSVKKLSPTPSSSALSNVGSVSVGANNMFDKMRVEKSSSSLLDNRLAKLKKTTNSYSTSSLLLKNSASVNNSRQLSNISGSSTNRQMSSLSGSGSGLSIGTGTGNSLSTHKRTGSTATSKPISISSSLKM